MRAVLKALFICLLLFVVFCVVIAVRSDKSQNGPGTISDGEQPQRQSYALAVKPQSVSALQLFMDYQRNEVAADNIYKGHLLAVQGIVTSINKDIFDKVYISLATPNQFMNVQAHLEQGSESQAAALQRGEVITVICTGGGMMIGSPMLQNCSFAKLRDESSNYAQTPSASTEAQTTQPAIHQSEAVADTGASPATENSDAEGDAPRKIGGSVSAPQLISSPNPEFPEAARQANMGANVLVHMLVNRNGMPSDVQVIRTVYVDRDGHASGGANSVGNNLGFNENAVNAVKQYMFKPAMENGTPVPVELNVNVSFQISN